VGEIFVEVFVDAPIEVWMTRDPKGLYKRVAAGQIRNFTGIDSPYELPEGAELTLETELATPEDLAERVVAYLKAQGLIP
jgi:bifunctional enzyme CysN/CysC